MEAQEYSFRSLLPPQPLQWLAVRARIYLMVAVAAVAGFFFVAEWLAQPIGHIGWLGLFPDLAHLWVVLVFAFEFFLGRLLPSLQDRAG